MSGAKPRNACPTTSRITVKEKILPLPLTCTHSSLSLAQSPHTGRGQKTHVPQFWHFCIMSLPDLAPSQKGWLTGVISGRGLRISSFAMLLNLSVILQLKILPAWANFLLNVSHGDSIREINSYHEDHEGHEVGRV